MELPPLDDRVEGRKDKKKPKAPPPPDEVVVARIEAYLIRLATELALYEPPEEKSPPPVDIPLLSRSIESCGLDEGPKWADEIDRMNHVEELDDSPDEELRERRRKRERRERKDKEKKAAKAAAKEEEIAVTVIPIPAVASSKSDFPPLPQPAKIARTSSQSSQSFSQPISQARSHSQSQNPDSASSHMTSGSANLSESLFLQRQQGRHRGGIGAGRMMQIEMQAAGSGRVKGRLGKDERKKVERGRVERPAIGGLVGSTAKVGFTSSIPFGRLY